MSKISIVLRNENFIKVTVAVGASIEQACAEATALSVLNRLPVHFNFNGIEIKADPSANAATLLSDFCAASKSRRELWLKSEDGKRFTAQQKDQLSKHQETINMLMQELPQALETEASTVAWVGKFAVPADHRGTVFDASLIIKKLESAGYTRNSCATPIDVDFGANAFARHLIGETLDCLYRGKGPHCVAARLADDYAAKFSTGHQENGYEM